MCNSENCCLKTRLWRNSLFWPCVVISPVKTKRSWVRIPLAWAVHIRTTCIAMLLFGAFKSIVHLRTTPTYIHVKMYITKRNSCTYSKHGPYQFCGLSLGHFFAYICKPLLDFIFILKLKLGSSRPRQIMSWAGWPDWAKFRSYGNCQLQAINFLENFIY
jgi:hypothetical protein